MKNLDLIPASSLFRLLKVNVDNEKLSDKQFRDLIRKTLPIVRKSNILKAYAIVRYSRPEVPVDFQLDLQDAYVSGANNAVVYKEPTVIRPLEIQFLDDVDYQKDAG